MIKNKLGLSPHRGVILVKGTESPYVLSLSPARGSYSRIVSMKIYIKTVCPPRRGVIPMNSKKEAVWLSLSTIRGVILNNVIAIFMIDSLSPTRGVIPLNFSIISLLYGFVPRERELFYPVGMQIYRRSVCLSTRERYSIDMHLKCTSFYLLFTQGSYFQRKKLI